ncbi:hypothetical protein Clacol_009763 [Clathrus columnatus]|uniref:alpha-L-fucosidase n=1 Tax=Clathrus columnatus TaxID=1419009 RepID=A0AAV5ARU5_9AGAM|nr:hypothetical protein Clacol_009763 [Clathrus columnatus]
MIRGGGEVYGRFKPKTYIKIFITVDIISLFVQGAGGGLAATSSSTTAINTGGDIVLVGIVFQLLLAAEFIYRFRLKKPLKKYVPVSLARGLMAPGNIRPPFMTPKLDSSMPEDRINLMIISLSIATILLIVRSFTLPPWRSSSFDNIVAQGQNITPPIPGGHFQSLHLLSSADGSSTYTNNISVTYKDGTLQTQPLLIAQWTGARGVINSISEFTYTATGINGNASHIQYFEIPLNAGKELASIILPTGEVSGISSEASKSPGPSLTFQYIRSRNQWFNDSARPSPIEDLAMTYVKPLDTSRSPITPDIVQVIEVAISNLPFSSSQTDTSSWLTGQHTVVIQSSHVDTVYAGILNRLRSGDQARVKVGVVNAPGVERGTSTTASAVVWNSHGDVIAQSVEFGIVAGIPIYEPTIQSLQVHEASKWHEDSKIPAFAPSGLQYAEWYWWQQHNPNNTNSPTWVYHKETYGEQFVYDDFIPMFDPVKEGWSPDIFTNLFQEAGAGYFVLVTKHHDGFCLFDSQNTTHRSSLNYGPKTDLIDSIITSSETLHPNLVPGTYFSLPEWFNPAYAKYGFSSWPGGLAHNAYNWSELEPYTGFIPVEDFITDVQAPQMRILVGPPDGESKGYDTNILWCDIGGPTNVTEVIPDWYNRKYLEGKNVVIDDRCGTWVYDFDTPEYSTYGVVKQDKWETTSGLDPFSYGYNAQTPAANYMNTTTGVHMLIDIVSKNGNWLLDIGPMKNGSIVEPEVTTLRGMGSWLKNAGKAIYATDYWFIGPQESSNLRFTTTPLAFYITTLTLPTPSFSIRSPVPILNGDEITLLGGSGEKLKFEVNDDEVIIYVSENEASLVKDAWAFESQSTAASSPSTAPSLDPPTPAATHLPVITPDDDGNKIISSLGRKINPDMNTLLESVPSLPSGSTSAKRQKSRSLTLGKEVQSDEENPFLVTPDNRTNFISRIFSSYSNGSPVSITPGRKRSSTLPLSSEITRTPQTPTPNASPSDSYHTPTNGSSPNGSLPSAPPSSISGSGRYKRSYLSHTPEKPEGDLNTQRPLLDEDNSIRYDHNASPQHDISSPESATLGAIFHSGKGIKSQGRSSTIESPLVTAVTTQSDKISFTPPRTSTPPPLGRSTNSYRRQPLNTYTYPPRSRSRHTFDEGSRSSILSESPILFPSFRRMSESLGKIMTSPSSSDKARKEKEAPVVDDVFTDTQNKPSNGTFILTGERRLSADWSSVEAVRGDVGGAESWPSSVSKEMVRLSLKDSPKSAGNNELRRTTSSPVKSVATDVDLNPKNPTLFGSIGEDRRAFFRAISGKGHAGRRGHKERSSLTQLMTALGVSNGNGSLANRNNDNPTDGNVSESKSTNAKIETPTLTRGGGSSIPLVSVTASTPVEPHPPHRPSVMSDPGPGLNVAVAGSAAGSKRKIADADDEPTTSFLVASSSAPVNTNTNKNSVRSILVTRSESMDRPSDASHTSHAPSSFRLPQSKRIRLSETPPPSQSQSRAASPPRSPPRNRNTSSSPQPSRPGSAAAVAVNPRGQSRTSLDSRRHNNRSPSLSESASIPVMAILTPRAPSIDTRHSLNTYHMRDPSLPPSRRQSAVWKGAATRKVLDEDILGMKSRSSLDRWGVESSLFPLQGWAFVVGFLVFPLWWVAAICPVIWGWGSRWKKRRFGDIHLIYTEEELQARETLEYDVAYTWRKRCRIMSVFGLFVYVPLIVLIAVLVPRSA